jgi:two-component system NtrC family response regulator
MAKPKLLIVEDDPGLCGLYRWALPAFDVVVANDRKQAGVAARREEFPVAIVDLGLPPDPDGVSEGFATVAMLVGTSPDTKVIVVTSHGDRPHALRAVAAGAYDFCEKPADVELLRTIAARALHLFELGAENRRLSQALTPMPIKQIVTANRDMLKICRDVEKLATANVTVMLTGESGTGKEALARALHELGPRARHPMVTINCGAIPENLLESELFGHERGAFTGAVRQTIGKIEAADRGTLFLDEIGDLPHPLQVKLLRVLQEQVIERVGGRQHIPVNVRIISATNRSLDELVAQGGFRQDLLYRLNTITVRIPPLRERAGDPMLLAHFFLNRLNREFGRDIKGFTEAATTAIANHDWPGNVRELENRMKRAVLMTEGRQIDVRDLELGEPEVHEDDLDLRSARHRVDREMVLKAVARSNGKLVDAAKLLGVSRPTLYAIMELHAIPLRGSRSQEGTDQESGPKISQEME